MSLVKWEVAKRMLSPSLQLVQVESSGILTKSVDFPWEINQNGKITVGNIPIWLITPLSVVGVIVCY